MWYQKIVEAGALDELAGGLDTSESPDIILREMRQTYSLTKLANFESIYKYINELINSDYTSTVQATIEHLISIYSQEPEHIHKANRLVPLLIKIGNKTNSTKMSLLPDGFKAIGDTIETHNSVYNFGYNKILAYMKEGVSIPKSMCLYIMMNLDTTSSSSMQQSEARTEIKKNIIDKDPMYEYLDADKFSGEEIIKNILDNIHSTAGRNLYSDVIWNSGLPIDDYLYLLDKAHEENIMDDIPEDYELLILNQNVSKYVGYLDKNKDKFSPEHFEKRYKGAFKYGMSYLSGDFWYEQCKKYRQYFNDMYPNIARYYKPSLNKLGVGPKEDIIKLYLQALEEDPAQANSTFREIPSQEEIEDYKQKYTVQNNQPANQVANPQNTSAPASTLTSTPKPAINVFQKNLQNGNIEEHDSTGEYGKLLDDILKSFGFNQDDQNIIDDIKSRLKIYVFKNTTFYMDLMNTALQKYDFITPRLLKTCGYFVPKFSDNNNGPSIFINEFISETYVSSDNIIKNLGITKDMINMSTAAHELAHLADYVIKGGSEVFKNVDPKTSIRDGEVYNESRLYLSDIREIVARVYGNTSYMIELLHKRIDEMRTSEIIKKAVMDELSDMLMSNEASWLNATPMVSEQKLQEWAEKRFGPYEHSDRPYSQATEDYLKQKQLAIKFYEEAGKVNREDIKKEAIDELETLEDQAEVLKTRVSEDSEE